MKNRFSIAALPLLFLLSSPTADAAEFKPVPFHELTARYDQYFRKYTKRYFGVGFDWKWFKAQAYAESRINQQAKSWVNAKGIMQIMPRTFEEIRKRNPSFYNINEPRWNIAAGIYYDQTMFGKWKAERPFKDRMNFMFASYNAGFATIVKAQKKAKDKGLNENLWKNIEAVGPEVRRWRHKETLGYVNKIGILMREWSGR